MGDFEEGFGRHDPNAELLGELALERREASFIRPFLATRKLPRAGHVSSGPALTDQESACGVANDRDDDVYRFHGRVAANAAPTNPR
jgi:hypothetical protein